MRGVKDVKGKARLDLIPYDALVAIAEVREYGNDKYEDPSMWYTGMAATEVTDEMKLVMQFVAAAMRHSFKFTDSVYYKNRPEKDKESHIHHLKHAACSLTLAVALLDKGEKQ